MIRRLAAHVRRWARLGGTHAVTWRGEPIAEIDTAFKAACRRAGVEDLTIHDLKPTAVTWFFRNGGTKEDAAEFFDTTARTFERVYRQHSPEFQARAVAVMEGR